MQLPIRIAITGAGGKMGQQLIRSITELKDVTLSVVLSRINSSFYGIDAGQLVGISPLGVIIEDNLKKVKDNFDILIDFTCPDSSIEYLNLCCKYNKNIVIGTTGFNDDQKNYINLVSKKIGIVLSSNFSIGVNLMFKILEKTSKIIGNQSDIEIIEMHHRNKIDIPSGSALAMKKEIVKSFNYDLNNTNSKICQNSQTKTNYNKECNIKFTSIRAGDIVGEHTVMFIKNGERLEIIHKASNRSIFADGAICAAKWLANKKEKGLFDMIDVLGLNIL